MQAPILHLLSERQLRQLAHAMETVSYKQGEVVFRAGAEADYFYVVEDGTFTVFGSGWQLRLADWSDVIGMLTVVAVARPSAPSMLVASSWHWVLFDSGNQTCSMPACLAQARQASQTTV
jgi:signal-transduction protein with cAMP-binding, CBS, and nucleotidyltransferase domain